MYYIVLGEFAGLFYSPVNWESFSELENKLQDNMLHYCKKICGKDRQLCLIHGGSNSPRLAA